MEKTDMKDHRVILSTALAILAAVVLRLIGFRVNGLLRWFCCILRPVIYIGLFTQWGGSVRRRIIQPQVRCYLSTISALMVFWITARTLRYLFVEEPGMKRLLWYLYYLPMLFIPLLAVFVALSLGKPESYRLPGRTAFLYLPTAALLLLVLTNDFHQLVFVFPPDAAVWANDYHYDVGYFPTVGWMTLCALAALVLMLMKCRIPGSRRVFLLPFVPFLMVIIYGVLYIFRVPWLRTIAGDITVVFCLLFAAALESCIRCGLIQTNTGYEALFVHGTIGAQITDEEYHVRYASANAMTIPEDMMRAAEQGSVSLDKNTLLKSSSIRGGHVLWQEDITDITALLEKLEENRKTIEDSNCIEEENYKTKVKINTLREKNRLYDQLMRKTASQINRLDELLNQYEAEHDPAIARRLLAKIGVVGAYVKRRGNLIFIEEKAEVTDTAELLACLEESFAGLKLMDVDCALAVPEGQRISVQDAARVYDFFEAVTEAALDALSFLWLKGRVLEHAIVFLMEVESAADLSLFAGLADTCACEDGVWRFTLRVGKAGEPA